MTDINGFPLSALFMKGNYHDDSVFHKHIRDAYCPKKIQIINLNTLYLLERKKRNRTQ